MLTTGMAVEQTRLSGSITYFGLVLRTFLFKFAALL